MNAFTLLLLAWPFYLAVNGKLVTYVDFAKPGNKASQNSGASGAMANTEGDANASLSTRDIIETAVGAGVSAIPGVGPLTVGAELLGNYLQ